MYVCICAFLLTWKVFVLSLCSVLEIETGNGTQYALSRT